MDKQDFTIRAYLDEGAHPIGAIRLPNTAFRANAGVEMTTDILFMRKRKLGEARQRCMAPSGAGADRRWADANK